MSDELTLRPVGVYHCGFPEKFGLPRQSGLAPAIMGRIEFAPAFQNPDYLRGIEGYSHLWLLWYFSEAGPADSPTVRPPKLGGNTRVGVFASRSPYRPNPIGLSCVKFESVGKTKSGARCLFVSGGDLADGTPVFDIKPYLAYTDAHPDAASGFAKTEGTLEVAFPPALLEEIPPELRSALLQSLSLDPRPGYQDDPDRVYYLRCADRDVGFTAADGVLRVVEVKRASD